MSRRIMFTTFAMGIGFCAPVMAFAGEPRPLLDQMAITRALSHHPDDPLLNFLSGLAYERSATSSTEARELARVGYRMALREDSGFWRAAYQLGLMALEDRDPLTAQRYLLSAAVDAPSEGRVFLALSRAAYCSGDLGLASSALARAKALPSQDGEDYALTQALIAAAANDRAGVEALLPRLSPLLREAVASRLSAPREQASGPALPSPTVSGSAASPAASDAAGARKMAVVDVVVIRRSENAGTNDGINLLDSLSLQLGGNLINRNWNKSTDQIDPSLSTSTISSAQSLQLTVPAVTYSLNLANARGSFSRIEARPTLLIYDGVEATIFDGGTLTFATDGQLNSSSYTREVGLSLAVKPKFINDEAVNLSVKVTLENFSTTVPAGTFRQSLQTEKSSTEVAADVRFGQTMLVSGGTSSMVKSGLSKTPVVGDIPVLGKLFAARSKNTQSSELLVLLSLRRIPGEMASRESGEERKLTATLRARVFPDLPDDALLVPETRQLFYRIANPAHTGTEAYLAPIAEEPALRQLHEHP